MLHWIIVITWIPWFSWIFSVSFLVRTEVLSEGCVTSFTIYAITCTMETFNLLQLSHQWRFPRTVTILHSWSSSPALQTPWQTFRFSLTQTQHVCLIFFFQPFLTSPQIVIPLMTHLRSTSHCKTSKLHFLCSYVSRNWLFVPHSS